MFPKSVVALPPCRSGISGIYAVAGIRLPAKGLAAGIPPSILDRLWCGPTARSDPGGKILPQIYASLARINGR